MSDKKVDLDKVHNKIAGPKQPTKAQLKERERQEKEVLAAANKITEALKKHSCKLIAVTTIVGAEVTQIVDIGYVPKESGLIKAQAKMPPKGMPGTMQPPKQ